MLTWPAGEKQTKYYFVTHKTFYMRKLMFTTALVLLVISMVCLYAAIKYNDSHIFFIGYACVMVSAMLFLCSPKHKQVAEEPVAGDFIDGYDYPQQ